MMVAAISEPASTADLQTPKFTPTQDEHSRRSPLLPSEKDNSNGVSKNQRKPKSRIVNSRYLMSPSSSTSIPNSSPVSSSSRRFPSPLISRKSTPAVNATSLGLKRSVSVDRTRPLISDLGSKSFNSNEVLASTKLIVTSSRRLSVSFQVEAFTLPISKTKVNPPSPYLSNVRKATPERTRSSKVDVGGDQVENSRPSDQYRWPARNRTVNPLQQSMIDETRPSVDRKSSLDFDLGNNSELVNRNSFKNDDVLMPSDSDSVSSGSTSEAQECDRASNGLNGLARFQETNNRLRRMNDHGSPLSPQSKLIVPPKSKRYSSDGPLSSPIRGSIGPASSRAYSPARIRNAVSTISNSFVETPSVLSFAVDIRRGKVGENRIVDAHFSRHLYNRHLQWRFVNARSEGGLLVQEHSMEKNHWNAWITISNLRDNVTKKNTDCSC